MNDASLDSASMSAESHLDSWIDRNEAGVAAQEIVTILEVRVLTGLSRGAALPIESPLFIGADPQCDIFLMDPGVADRHLRVDVEADGRVTLLDLTAPAAGPVEQLESRPFHAGEVRLVWCRSDRPWEDAVFDTDDAPDAGHDEESPSPAAAPPRSRRLMPFGLAVAAALSLVLGAALVVARQRSAKTSSPVRLQALREPSQADVGIEVSRLQKVLRARDFPQLSVEARGDRVLITGNIRADQQQELETLIQTWKRDNPSIRIVLQLADATPTTLPFQIVAMVGGSSPSVLASTGDSLYLGSESSGYRLVLFNGTCLTFERIDTHQRLKECLAPSPSQR